MYGLDGFTGLVKRANTSIFFTLRIPNKDQISKNQYKSTAYELYLTLAQSVHVSRCAGLDVPYQTLPSIQGVKNEIS